MATFEVDIDDGLVDCLRAILPPGWTVDDWLSLKCEEAIGQARVDYRRRQIEVGGATGRGGVDPEANGGSVPDDALRTNDDKIEDGERPDTAADD